MYVCLAKKSPVVTTMYGNQILACCTLKSQHLATFEHLHGQEEVVMRILTF